MSKIYVLDTNVLLNDPMALHAFHEHRVVVPMTVLEELDNIKDKRDRDVSREARIAINTIDGYLGDATPQQISAGVALPRVNGVDPGSLAVFPDQLIADEDDDIPFLSSGPHQANDNRIINVAL
ncbi:MAG TPA: ribonuclease, partial [Gammaproteobacteria bacterium]|nr:ribonuclease [Gammaproteobacteria bacterium]